MRFVLSTLFFLCTIQVSLAQKLTIFETGVKNSFRGLSVPSPSVVWVSGTGGTVGLSTNGGDTWKFIQVPGYEKVDFRDIHAWNDREAIIMGIASPAYMLKTFDGGITWKQVYVNKDTSMFLDDMYFSLDKLGVVVGDPIDGKFFTAHSKDSGNTWIERSYMPALPGEACFAASGSNIAGLGNHWVLVTGGHKSQLQFGYNAHPLPIIQGSTTTGANAIDIKPNGRMIIVGGDFEKRERSDSNCVLGITQYVSFKLPKKNPSGYRSGIAWIKGRTWITCGLNGIDITKNNGKVFEKIADAGFHVVRRSPNGKVAYLAGGQGRIGKITDF